MDDQERFVRAIDRAIDRHADGAGYIFVELMLQQRAQDMRECAYSEGEAKAITADDLDGWAE